MVKRDDGNGAVVGWKSIAEWLNIAIPTARRWKKKYKLPVSIKGRTPITTRKALEMWVLGKKFM